MPNPRSAPLFRCCFPCAGGAPPAPGFQGNSTFGLRLFQALSLSAAALAMPNSLPNSEARRQGSPETAPPQKPLNDASGGNRLCHISSIVITNLDIFRLRPLRFLLLRFSRKSFAKSQKLFRKFPARVQLKEAARLLKIPLWGRDF